MTGAQITFEELRETFRADGADVTIREVKGDQAVIELLIDSEACDTGCILPKPALERLLLPAVTNVYPAVRRIVVIDPRE